MNLQQMKDAFFVDEVKAQQNIFICSNCPDMVEDTLLLVAVKTCGKLLSHTETTCGCVVDGHALAKTRLKGFSCPQNKWTNETL